MSRRADAALFDDCGAELTAGQIWDAPISQPAHSIPRSDSRNGVAIELGLMRDISAAPAQASAFFRVTEEPCLRQINGVFGDSIQKPPTMFANYTRILRRTNAILAMVSFVAVRH